MISPQVQNSERDSLDESAGDPPPAYDALSTHQSINRGTVTVQDASSCAFRGLVAGSNSNTPDSEFTRSNPRVLNIDKSLPSRPSSLDDTPPSPQNASPALVQRPHPRKNASWLSFLPFVSSSSAKRARQFVLSVVSDLVGPPSRVGNEEQKNAHETLASLAEACAEHKLSLSTILQETFFADHTPMYWAVVNYRQELLVALLVHSQPLSTQTVSDIRRACLASSNQALFHALRVSRPPFHKTNGIRVPSLRATSDCLLLGDQPLDKIQIQQTSDRAFVVSFDIPLWQRRIKAIGQVGIEFIVSGRMWSVTFFSTDPSSPAATSGKSKKTASSWHVMVSLLESSPPTYFDSQLVVGVTLPLVPKPIHAPRLREARSTTYLPSYDKLCQSRSSMHDYDYDGKTCTQLSRDLNILARPEQDRQPSSSSYKLPPPTHPLRNSPSSTRPSTTTSPRFVVHLGCGDHKLGRRTGPGKSSPSSEATTTRPDKWSDHDVSYTNAAVSPLGDDITSHLLYDRSRYLLPDGTLRGRLEARLVKSDSSKNCIIC